MEREAEPAPDIGSTPIPATPAVPPIPGFETAGQSGGFTAAAVARTAFEAAPIPPRSSHRALVLAVALAAALGLGYYLSDVLNPFLIGLLIAYVLNPVVEKLEKWRVRRSFAVSVLFGAVLLSVVGTLGFGAFMAAEHLDEIRRDLAGERLLDEKDPTDKATIERLKKVEGSPLRKTPEGVYFVSEDLSGARKVGLIEKITDAVKPKLQRISHERLESFARALEAQAGDALSVGVKASKGLQEFLKQLTNFFGYVFLVPLYSFFLLLSLSDIQRHVSASLPGAYRARVLDIAGKIDRALAAFFRGRLLIALAKGVLTWFGLWLVGVRFAFFIGMAAGLLSVVPLLGPLVGGVLGCIFAYESGGSLGMRCLGVCLVFAGAETFEAFAYPAVLGRNVGLHPLALILAVFSFGKIFGLFGVLLAVPFACVVKILFEEFVLPEVRALAAEPPRGEGG
ncbi:AI-2E family transporter [bacterium]|nr:AI-2E family transporter [bacterium]